MCPNRSRSGFERSEALVVAPSSVNGLTVIRIVRAVGELPLRSQSALINMTMQKSDSAEAMAVRRGKGTKGKKKGNK